MNQRSNGQAQEPHQVYAESFSDGSAIAPLLLTAREAAQVLRVSERTLWGLTHPRGPIRPLRIGTSVRYAIVELERWIDEELKGATDDLAT